MMPGTRHSRLLSIDYAQPALVLASSPTRCLDLSMSRCPVTASVILANHLSQSVSLKLVKYLGERNTECKKCNYHYRYVLS
jgi:hypothetical protein